jgi:hypothetical protein
LGVQERGGDHPYVPIAADFYDGFELGDSEKRIATADTEGVALSVISGIVNRLGTAGQKYVPVQCALGRQIREGTTSR